jgi:hypothetical protein
MLRLARPVVFSAAVATGHLHLRIAGFAICPETGFGELVRVESTKTDRLNFARGVAAAYRVFVTRPHPVVGESSD